MPPYTKTQTLRINVTLGAAGEEYQVPQGGTYFFLVSSTGNIKAAVGEDQLTPLKPAEVKYLPDGTWLGKDNRFLKLTSDVASDNVTFEVGFGKALPLDLVLNANFNFAPAVTAFSGNITSGGFKNLIIPNGVIAYLEVSGGVPNLSVTGSWPGSLFALGNNAPINMFDINGTIVGTVLPAIKAVRFNVTGYGALFLSNVGGAAVNYNLYIVGGGQIAP